MNGVQADRQKGNQPLVGDVQHRRHFLRPENFNLAVFFPRLGDILDFHRSFRQVAALHREIDQRPDGPPEIIS